MTSSNDGDRVDCRWIEREATLDKLRDVSEFLNDRERPWFHRFLEQFRRIEVKAGGVIVEQGRLRKSYYVIESGKVEVMTRLPDGTNHVCKHLSPYDCFGELATIYRQPRAATVTAAEDCVVWEVDEASMQQFLICNPQLDDGFSQKRRYRQALSRVHWFLPIIHDEIKVRELIEAFQSEEFAEGEIVLKQGDNAIDGKFYVVLEGQCEVMVKKGDKPPASIARLGAGDSFGELALMRRGSLRNATIQCAERTTLLSIGRRQFHSSRLWSNFAENASVVVDGERFINMQDLGRILLQGDRSDDASLVSLIFEAAKERTQKIMSWPEFVILTGLLHRENSHLQLAFMFADRNQDGFVTREEFRDAMAQLTAQQKRFAGISQNNTNLKSAESEMEHLFDEMFEGSDSLTFDEFSTMLQKEKRLSAMVKVWDDVVLRMKSTSANWFVSAIEVGFESDFPASLASPVNVDDNTHRPWLYLTSGAIAGAVSRTCVSPLIRLKMIMQTGKSPPSGVISGLRSMYVKDGFRGLFQGNGSNILRIAPTTALQFLFFETIKSWMNQGDNGRPLSVPERLIGGGFAGMGAAILTYPLDFIRARLTIQSAADKKYNGIIHGINVVIKTEGYSALFRGLWPTILGVFPYIGIDFAVFETLKPLMPCNETSNGRRGSTTAGGLLLAGGVAGLISQTLAFPLELVRRRLQVQGFTECSYGYNGGVFDALQKTVARDGFSGLYRGMSANMVKAVPSISISFFVYERCKASFDLQ